MTNLKLQYMGFAILLLAGSLAAAQVTTDSLACAWNIAPADPVFAVPMPCSVNSGWVYGSVAYATDPAMGPALQFFGAEESAFTVPYTSALEPPTGTLEVWINPAFAQNADVADKVTGGRVVYGLTIWKTGRVRAAIGTMDKKGNYLFKFVTSPHNLLTPNQWHQLVMRWDGTELAVFVDGNLVAADSYAEVPGTGLNYAGDAQPFFLGLHCNWGGGGTIPYSGLIGITRLYSRPLSDMQLLDNYLATKPQ